MSVRDTPGVLVERLRITYGRRVAVEALSFALPLGRSLALAGGNGAGKTSTLLVLAGLLHGDAAVTGAFAFTGARLAWGDIPARRHFGIGLVPDRAKVFLHLTVSENLDVTDRGASARVRRDDVFDWFPRLGERRKTLAGNLSGGEQQMLAIAMALLGDPRFLMLDEPTLGLASPIIEGLCTSLARLRHDLALTLLVAESDTQWLRRLADAAVVIDRGRVSRTYDDLAAADHDEIHDVMLGLGVPEPDREAVHA